VSRKSGSRKSGVKIYDLEEIGISETTFFIFNYSTAYSISFILSLLHATMYLFHNSFHGYGTKRENNGMKRWGKRKTASGEEGVGSGVEGTEIHSVVRIR
jgi:hypothetical protein